MKIIAICIGVSVLIARAFATVFIQRVFFGGNKTIVVVRVEGETKAHVQGVTKEHAEDELNTEGNEID